jgi:signal transduction histidine kinase
VLVKLKISQAKHGPAHRSLEMIKQAEQLLNESLTYIRELVAELSPPVLHEFGLPAAIRWLGEQMKRFDLNVMLRIDTDDDLSLPEDQAILLFQSTRELLINVAKHAETKEAVVAVAMHDGTLRITVQDQGVGFVPSLENTLGASSNFSTFGLLSIRERMHALGGRCEIHSAPGQGTTSTLILPFQLSQK